MAIFDVRIDPDFWNSSWEVLNKIDIVIGIIGFPATIVGFLIAINESKKTRTAATAAKAAVEGFRRDINRINIVSEFTSALALIDEAKRLFRSGAFSAIPDRLLEAKKCLITVRISHKDFDDAEETTFQGAILELTVWESKFADFLSKNSTGRIPQMHGPLTQSADALHSVLVSLKQNVGEVL